MALHAAGGPGRSNGRARELEASLELVPRCELEAELEAALLGRADPLRPPRCQPLPLAGTTVAAGFPSPATTTSRAASTSTTC